MSTACNLNIFMITSIFLSERLSRRVARARCYRTTPGPSPPPRPRLSRRVTARVARLSPSPQPQARLSCRVDRVHRPRSTPSPPQAPAEPSGGARSPSSPTPVDGPSPPPRPQLCRWAARPRLHHAPRGSFRVPWPRP